MLSVILTSLPNNNLMVFCISAVSFTPAEVFEGDRLTVNCNVTPKIKSVIWKWELNGSPITSNSWKQTYMVDKVSQKDAGTWSCLMRNKETQVWTQEVKASTLLQVKGEDFFFTLVMQL